MLKRWFNKTLALCGRSDEELCGHRWCLRVWVYDYRCHRHQDDA